MEEEGGWFGGRILKKDNGWNSVVVCLVLGLHHEYSETGVLNW